MDRRSQKKATEGGNVRFIFIRQLLTGHYIQCDAEKKEVRGCKSYCIRRIGHFGKHRNTLGKKW